MNATAHIVERDLAPGYMPDQTVTEAQRLWAASNLADLPTIVRVMKNSVVAGTGDQGRLFRRAFVICATPGYRFAINLLSGASPADLKHARRIIERAKGGWFNEDIWTPKTFDTGRSGYVMDSYWEWDGQESKDEIRACTTPGCTDGFHEYRGGEFNDVHRAEGDIDKDHYLITLRNYEDEDKWAPYIDLDSDMPVGPAGLKILRDAVNDYAWLQQEADNLNAAATEVEA